MQTKRAGRQTVQLSHPPSVVSFANIGGRMEGQGPLSDYFDELSPDTFFGKKTWEQGESAMQERVLRRALEKGGLTAGELDYVLAGDLLNQCIGTSFGLRSFHIPFYGLYGACSTMGESLSLAALLIDGGFARLAAAGGDLHAGYGSFERFGDVAHDALLEFAALDDGGRTGERLLLGRTVGHDHHAFDLGGVLPERDVDAGLVADRDFLGLVAQVGDDERGVGRDVRQGVVSIDVRRDALRSALHENVRADDGFAVGSGDFAADGDVLRPGGRRPCQRQDAPENCCYLVHRCTLI